MMGIDPSLLKVVMAWPLEWLVLIGLGFVSMVDSIRAGPSRSIAVALAFLTSTFLYGLMGDTYFLGAAIKLMGAWQPVTFLFLFALLVVLFSRIVSAYNADTGGPLLAILTACATVTLLIITWIHTPALESLYHMSAPLQFLFTESYRLYWTLGALGVFAYVRS